MIMVGFLVGNVDVEVVGLDDGRPANGTEAGLPRMLQTIARLHGGGRSGLLLLFSYGDKFFRSIPPPLLCQVSILCR